MAGYAGPKNTTVESGRRDTLVNNRPTYREVVEPKVNYLQGIETPIGETVDSRDTASIEYEVLVDDVNDDRTTIPAGRAEYADWTTGYTVTTGRVRYRTYCTIHDNQFAVSRSQQSQDEYGVASEYDQLHWKKLQELGLDMEMIALWQEMSAVSPRKTHGLIPFALDTSVAGPVLLGGIASNEIPAPFKATVFAGPGTPLTKVQLRDNIMQPAWSKGITWSRMMVFVGPRVRNAFTGFTHIFSGSGPTLTSTPLRTSAPAELNAVRDEVDVYHGPWGVMYVANHRKLDTDTAITGVGAANLSIVPSKTLLAYDPRYVRFRFKLRPTSIHLPPLGDGQAGRTITEFGVEVANPRSLVFAYDIG